MLALLLFCCSWQCIGSARHTKTFFCFRMHFILRAMCVSSLGPSVVAFLSTIMPGKKTHKKRSDNGTQPTEPPPLVNPDKSAEHLLPDPQWAPLPQLKISAGSPPNHRDVCPPRKYVDQLVACNSHWTWDPNMSTETKKTIAHLFADLCVPWFQAVEDLRERVDDYNQRNSHFMLCCMSRLEERMDAVENAVAPITGNLDSIRDKLQNTTKEAAAAAKTSSELASLATTQQADFSDMTQGMARMELHLTQLDDLWKDLKCNGVTELKVETLAKKSDMSEMTQRINLECERLSRNIDALQKSQADFLALESTSGRSSSSKPTVHKKIQMAQAAAARERSPGRLALEEHIQKARGTAARNNSPGRTMSAYELASILQQSQAQKRSVPATHLSGPEA